jgi:pyruvate formate lyase activating enzyme
MKEASFYRKELDGKVQCLLCPHRCILDTNKTGICRVRKNIGGKLIAENYGLLTSVHMDPIEKKPLYHFHPGEKILSIGSAGCNMHCSFCQNFEISQTGATDFSNLTEIDPSQIAATAKSTPKNIGIAYTYNEPTVFYEYMMDTANLIQNEGLKNVMVTNGFIGEKPLHELLLVMDAFNVDLKAFNNDFYQKQTHSQLEPVKKTLQLIRDKHKHLEITNLVIPQLNDNEKEFTAMVLWIARTLGKETILHLSKYFPRYRSTQSATSEKTLLALFNIAKQHLQYVYLGNVSDLNTCSDTFCSACGDLVIKRSLYNISIIGLNDDGSCKNCGNQIVHR